MRNRKISHFFWARPSDQTIAKSRALHSILRASRAKERKD